jgi:hypothetical protein
MTCSSTRAHLSRSDLAFPIDAPALPASLFGERIFAHCLVDGDLQHLEQLLIFEREVSEADRFQIRIGASCIDRPNQCAHERVTEVWVAAEAQSPEVAVARYVCALLHDRRLQRVTAGS